jgi:hypothetical protein
MITKLTATEYALLAREGRRSGNSAALWSLFAIQNGALPTEEQYCELTSLCNGAADERGVLADNGKITREEWLREIAVLSHIDTKLTAMDDIRYATEQARIQVPGGDLDWPAWELEFGEN